MEVDVPNGQTRWLSECSLVRFNNDVHVYVRDHAGEVRCTVVVTRALSTAAGRVALLEAIEAVMAP